MSTRSAFVRRLAVLLVPICLAAASLSQPLGVARGADSATSLTATVPTNLTADSIVARLVEANTARSRELRSYTGTRSYSLDYQGVLGHKQATLEVSSRFTGPSTKEFTIVSESGSKLLLNKVLKRLLDEEKEAANPENQRRTALTPENYSFELLGTETLPSGECYRLKVEPHQDNKFLYRGEICVNSKDFAVASIDAAPSKNPSFWTSSTQIEHVYSKIGQFWLPASNKSITKVRLGGKAVLTIEYTGYMVN
jgi:hypothetical protein